MAFFSRGDVEGRAGPHEAEPHLHRRNFGWDPVPPDGVSPRPRPVLVLGKAVRFIPRWVERNLAPPHGWLEDAQELDRCMRTILGARSEVDRRLGEGLLLFRSRYSPIEVYQGSLGDLVRNRLGFKGSQASELMAVARGLEGLPLVAAAFRRGELSRSKVVLLVRVATPETEAGWVRLARGVSVMELREIVKGYRRRREGVERVEETDPGEEMEEIRIAVRPLVKEVWRTVARGLVEMAEGGKVPSYVVLADACDEFHSSHAEWVPEPEEEREEGMPAGEEEGMPEGAGEGDEAGEGGVEVPEEEWLRSVTREEALEGMAPEPPSMPADLPDPEAQPDARMALCALRALAATQQSLNWQLGKALAVFRREYLHRALATLPGWDPALTHEDYVRTRLGISATRARELCVLDRALGWRPAVREAYRTGKLGWNKSLLVVRISSERTAGAWVERARRITLPRLDAEVTAMELFHALRPLEYLERTGGLPPSRELLEELEVVPFGRGASWRERLVEAATDLRRRLGNEELPARVWGRSEVRLRAPPEEAEYIRRVMEGVRRYLGQWGEAAEEETCLLYLVLHFAREQFPDPEGLSREDRERIYGGNPVYERDGCLCQYPGCTRREVQAHHVEWLSRGGEDTEENQGCLCPAHHHKGVHEGRVRMTGRAPGELLYEVGPLGDGSYEEVWRDDELLAGPPDPVLEWPEEEDA